MEKNTIQIKQWLGECYFDSVPSETMVKMWFTDFKRVRIDTNDAKRSGHTNSAIDQEPPQKIRKLVLADRKLKLCEIAEELKISEGNIFTILHEQVSVRKL